MSRLAFLADRLRREGHELSARQHYGRAAVLEADLLAALPDTERLYSTLAVSAAALWYKAKAPRELAELATQLLASDALTPEARAEITEMRDEAVHDAGS